MPLYYKVVQRVDKKLISFSGEHIPSPKTYRDEKGNILTVDEGMVFATYENALDFFYKKIPSEEFYKYAIYPCVAEDAKPVNFIFNALVQRMVIASCGSEAMYDILTGNRSNYEENTGHYTFYPPKGTLIAKNIRLIEECASSLTEF